MAEGEDAAIRSLRRVLEKGSGKRVSYKEAQEMYRQAEAVYSKMAREGKISQGSGSRPSSWPVEYNKARSEFERWYNKETDPKYRKEELEAGKVFA